MSDTCRDKPPTSLRRAAAVCVGLTLALSTVLGAPAIAADGDPDYAAIDRYVQREMDEQRIPGLALGIVQGERIVHVRGFGEADPSGRAVTPRTPFFIGSITKSFTALAVMQLSEAGQVDLDAPVQRYLPWWHVADPAASAEVTVRDLLYQVSGFSKATGNQYATSGGTGKDALEERVRALGSAELHRTDWHDLAVQQRQLLDVGHARAGGLRAALRGVRQAPHLRAPGDGPLFRIGGGREEAGLGHRSPLLVRVPAEQRTSRSIAAVWEPGA